MPRDNLMSTIDQTSSLNILCPVVPHIHGHSPQNFLSKRFSCGFPGEELFVVTQCSSEAQWEKPFEDLPKHSCWIASSCSPLVISGVLEFINKCSDTVICRI